MIARFVFPLLVLTTFSACNRSETLHSMAESEREAAEKRVSDAQQAAREAKAAEVKAQAEKKAAEERAATEKTTLSTKNYWDRCVDINQRFVANKSEIWFKEFRPSAVEAACREAATKLRELDTSNVDRQVVDHVNRAIRGYETIGAIAKVKGQESLLRDAADTLKFIYAVSKSSHARAYADGGWIEMGLGLFGRGRKATASGQEQTSTIASSIIESEEAVIKAIREKYGVELKPW